ncbi:solute carrier family 22 member 6-like [Pantherophis guttatus]|uniref:Solute carrier family 22 member 6-like n=1 Tax=Pantherophis guttatus TaxID=94885 RepID=A0ABM3YQW1_PANGU|nr:solute carrier family 22 member 6-like [Pantherophis guttatus]
MAPAKGQQRRLSLCPGPPVATIPFGDLLEEVGSMGTFQIFSVFFLSLPVLFLASHNLVQNFSAATPEHGCRRAQPGNLSQQENLVPLGQDLKPDSCQRFAGWLASDANDTTGKEVGLESCLDGWQYDHSTFASTIVTEWDLVCNLQPLKSLAQSLFMAGVLVGAFVLGDLSDRGPVSPGEVGRRPSRGRSPLPALSMNPSSPVCLVIPVASLLSWLMTGCATESKSRTRHPLPIWQKTRSSWTCFSSPSSARLASGCNSAEDALHMFRMLLSFQEEDKSTLNMCRVLRETRKGRS